jgi:hypothetical protein
MRGTYLGEVLQLRVQYQHVRRVFVKHALHCLAHVQRYLGVRGIERIEALLLDHVSQQSCDAIRVLASCARSQFRTRHVPQDIRGGDADAHSVHADHGGIGDHLDVVGLCLALSYTVSVSSSPSDTCQVSNSPSSRAADTRMVDERRAVRARARIECV